MSNKVFLPVQIEQMINNILNKKENVFVRANIRPNLLAINEEIRNALKQFDSEYDSELKKINNVKNISKKKNTA